MFFVLMDSRGVLEAVLKVLDESEPLNYMNERHGSDPMKWCRTIAVLACAMCSVT